MEEQGQSRKTINYYSQQMGENGSADEVQQWDDEKWLNFKYIFVHEANRFFIGRVKNNAKLFSLSTWK